MCKCTPNNRTPFCGRPGCRWPGTELEKRDDAEAETTNPILKWQRALRPNLPNEPDFERLAFVLRHACIRPQGRMVHVSDVCDALVELIPEQRELWLRANATADIRFVEGMTAFFQADEPESIKKG